jgi:hypothetical protein
VSKFSLQRFAFDGVGLVALSLGLAKVGSFPPALWHYLLILAGALLVVRGFFPRIFVQHIDRQPIADIEARDVEALDQWIIALILVVASSITWWQIHAASIRPLTLVCNVEGLPVTNTPPSAGTVLIDPSFPLGSVNHWLVGSSHGLPPDYSEEDLGRLIYRCELTNLTNSSMLDTYLGVRLLSVASRGSPMRGSSLCDGAVIIGNRYVIVPIGDLPAGHTFTFFHYNGSTSNCTQLVWDSARVSGVGFAVHLKMDEQTRRLVGLNPNVKGVLSSGSEEPRKPTQVRPSMPIPSIPHSRIRITNSEGVLLHNKTTNALSLTISVYFTNSGQLPAVGVQQRCLIRVVEKPLTPNEEIALANQVALKKWDSTKDGDEMQPGENRFFSMPNDDEGIAYVAKHYDDIVAGKAVLYLFFYQEYRDSSLPRNGVNVTEYCGWFSGDDLKTRHVCGRNRMFQDVLK